ncbi:MAG: DNA-binding protein [Gammaproteobacteria bacterium]|nr:MAG: DNA-binding protein [Gammaproteobacteria bacterium]
MDTLITIPGFSEPVSSLSHLGAALFFFILSFVLIYRHSSSSLKIIAILIMAFSSVLLLSMSGVYHLLDPSGVGRAVLQKLDHAAIFVLIAGTFTAVHLVMFRGVWRWGMIVLIWLFACVGITLKSIFFNDFPEWLSLSIYIGLGWLGVISAVQLWRYYGLAMIKPLFYGGVAYSVGAVIDFLQQPVLIGGVIGPHEIFHFAVLAGIGFHWAFIDKAFFKSQYPYTFSLAVPA